jgi:hydrogenase expression/formation protein HypE
MSCEGTVVMTTDSDKTEDLLGALAKHKTTKDAQVVGKVHKGKARVIMKTTIGGRKIIQVPYGEPIPRVC